MMVALTFGMVVFPTVVPAQFAYHDFVSTAQAQPTMAGQGQHAPTEPQVIYAGGATQHGALGNVGRVGIQLLELRDQAGANDIQSNQVMKAVGPNAKALSASYMVLTVAEKAGRDLTTQYDVRTFPTVLVLADNGQELARLTGQPTAEELRWAIWTVTQNGMSVPELKKAYFAQMLNADGLLTYLKLQDLAGEPAADLAMYFLGVVGPKNWTSPEAWEVIRTRVFDWQEEPILYLMHNHAAFRKLYGDSAVDAKLNAVCLSALLRAAGRGMPAQTFAELKVELLATGYVGMPQIVAQAEVQRYKLIGAWTSYAEAVRTYFRRYDSQDAAELDAEARCLWLHLHKIETRNAANLALGLAEKATKLAPQNPFYQETLAMLQAQTGASQQAWQTANKAVFLANGLNISLQDAPRVLELLKHEDQR